MQAQNNAQTFHKRNLFSGHVSVYSYEVFAQPYWKMCRKKYLKGIYTLIVKKSWVAYSMEREEMFTKQLFPPFQEKKYKI